MTKDDREVVSALRARLVDRVGKDRYEVWFGPSTRLCVRGGTLTIGVPNRFYQDWLLIISARISKPRRLEALGQPLLLEFRIDDSLGRDKTAIRAIAGRGDVAESTPSVVSAADGPSAQIAAVNATSPVATVPYSVSQVGAGQPRPRARQPRLCHRPPRSPLGHAPRPRPEPRQHGSCPARFASLTTFVQGDSNRLAFTTAQMAVERPGSISPLFIHGPHGVGKTHLVEGIWSSFRQTHRQATAIYLSAEQFTTYFLEALHGAGLPNFRRKYRNVSLLILDDIQFFAGKRATLVELLHTIDTIVNGGKQLVLTADRSLSALRKLWGRKSPPAWPAPRPATRAAGVQHPAGHRSPAGRRARSESAGRRAIVRRGAPDHPGPRVGRGHQAAAGHEPGADRPITLALAEEALADLIHTSLRPSGCPISKRQSATCSASSPTVCNRAQGQDGHVSADAGDVAGPQAHALGVVGDWPFFWPAESQHGHFGPEEDRRLYGRWHRARPRTAGSATSKTRFAASKSCSARAERGADRCVCSRALSTSPRGHQPRCWAAALAISEPVGDSPGSQNPATAGDDASCRQGEHRRIARASPRL